MNVNWYEEGPKLSETEELCHDLHGKRKSNYLSYPWREKRGRDISRTFRLVQPDTVKKKKLEKGTYILY